VLGPTIIDIQEHGDDNDGSNNEGKSLDVHLCSPARERSLEI
jgi:hypothetical protein